MFPPTCDAVRGEASVAGGDPASLDRIVAYNADEAR
jgi:hypothetical protein